MENSPTQLNFNTMKSVLVPTDFSEYATGGINMAGIIAEKNGCPIFLHHNVRSMFKWEGMSDLQKMEHPHVFAKTVEAERRLDKSIESDFDKELEVRKLITHGVTYEEITKSAQNVNADLIIMGSHGNENSDRYFIGSNIQRVIRAATCPVLAVKRDTDKKEIKRIVFPCQFDENVDKPFSEIKKLAKDLGAEVHLLYVNTPQRFMDTRGIRKEMENFCANNPDIKLTQAIYHHQDPVTGILEYCEETTADMVALVTHDRRHSAKYLIGITESLVFHSDLPVLSVNSNAYH
jgi:nucleotide-binding universal stress UspA family protein